MFAIMDLNAVLLRDQLVVFERFELLLTGDFSDRDLLIKQAINLLSGQPLCLVFGCGPGYFQMFYGYEFGLYPHNSIAEALLIYGLPLMLLITVLTAFGVIKYFKSVGSVDLFVVTVTYAFLISLKSGHLFGSWMLIAGVFFIISVAFRSLPIKLLSINATPA